MSRPRNRRTSGIARSLHGLDVGAGDAELLGRDQRIDGPAHHAEPILVALPHRRADHLLPGDLRQDDVVCRLGELLARLRQDETSADNTWQLLLA